MRTVTTALALLASCLPNSVRGAEVLKLFDENRALILAQEETQVGSVYFFRYVEDHKRVNRGSAMLHANDLISRKLLSIKSIKKLEPSNSLPSWIKDAAAFFGVDTKIVNYEGLNTQKVFDQRESDLYYYVVALTKESLLATVVREEYRLLTDVLSDLRRRLSYSKSQAYFAINGGLDLVLAKANQSSKASKQISNYVSIDNFSLTTNYYNELSAATADLVNLEKNEIASRLIKFPSNGSLIEELARRSLTQGDLSGYFNQIMLAHDLESVGIDHIVHLIDKTAATELLPYKNMFMPASRLASYPPIVSFVRKQQGFVNFSGDWDRSASQSHFRKAESKFSERQAIDTIQRDLFEALKSDPTHSESWNLLGVLIKASGDDMQGAVACFRQALRLDPKAPKPMANLALIYEELSKRELAAGMALAACLHAAPEDWAYLKSEKLLSTN